MARDLGTTRETVGKWRRRFVQAGCDGLLDAPRPGAPRRIGDDDVERGGSADAGSAAGGGDALEHPSDGRGLRPQRDDGEPHLAGRLA